LTGPAQRPLISAVDHGNPVTVKPELFAPALRDGGWGPFAETFLRMNEAALNALDVTAELSATSDGASIRLRPGGHTGAVPLRSAQSGKVAGGFVVRPRFGWAGVGRVLGEIRWYTAPEFLEQPLVPGSGREVPPWVLAGPVIARLQVLLRTLRRGYSEKEAVLKRPRGRILWDRYRSESLVRGRWDKLPCRFPELESDPRLRRAIRWTLERLHRDLVRVGGTDRVSAELAALVVHLIESHLSEVTPVMPTRNELSHFSPGGRLMEEALRRGLEAIAWIVEERGLGGGRELDGLAWQLPLDQLWENYVEAVIRREVAMTGGELRSGRLGQTVFPLNWSDPTYRTLGHLVPDIVVRRSRSILVIDAKYKAHLAEIDEAGWHHFADEQREAHRADLHQVLAYAALYDAEEITATLVYPVRFDTWKALKSRGMDISSADLLHGGRRITLQLRGLPFGTPSINQEEPD
jgi:5-methylcytosine-specific restriction endonuclease McrBC regulatory subunit McrC